MFGCAWHLKGAGILISCSDGARDRIYWAARWALRLLIAGWLPVRRHRDRAERLRVQHWQSGWWDWSGTTGWEHDRNGDHSNSERQFKSKMTTFNNEAVWWVCTSAGLVSATCEWGTWGSSLLTKIADQATVLERLSSLGPSFGSGGTGLMFGSGMKNFSLNTPTKPPKNSECCWGGDILAWLSRLGSFSSSWTLW